MCGAQRPVSRALRRSAPSCGCSEAQVPPPRKSRSSGIASRSTNCLATSTSDAVRSEGSKSMGLPVGDERAVLEVRRAVEGGEREAFAGEEELGDRGVAHAPHQLDGDVGLRGERELQRRRDRARAGEAHDAQAAAGALTHLQQHASDAERKILPALDALDGIRGAHPELEEALETLLKCSRRSASLGELAEVVEDLADLRIA